MTAYIFERQWPEGESLTMTVCIDLSAETYTNAADFMQDLSCKDQQRMTMFWEMYFVAHWNDNNLYPGVD